MEFTGGQKTHVQSRLRGLPLLACMTEPTHFEFMHASVVATERPNRSLEWTSATWPRYAHQFIIAARGQLSSAPQLQR